MRRLPTDPYALLLEVARLDRSGRLSARGLLRALGWRAGHRVDIDVVDAAIAITSAAVADLVLLLHEADESPLSSTPLE